MPQISVARRILLLVVILLGTLLGPLDSSVNIAFPDITRSFGIELKAIRWVVIAYVATYASLMLVFGRIGDLFGHERVFGGGLLVCIAGFTICGLAKDYNWLLLARGVQGIGTAMVLSCGPALATNLFGEHFRSRILGIYSMAFGLGGAVGPSIGGLLVDLWGWPAVFWFRIPLALAALVILLVLHMPPSPRARGRFDLADSLLLAGATGLFLLFLSQFELATTHPLYFGLLALATALATGAFIRFARHSSAPIIDLDGFSNFGFAWINIANVIVNFAGFATMLFVPYFLVQISGIPLWQSGLIMAAGPIAMMAAANVAGWTIPTIGADRLAIAGAVLVASGLHWMSFWDGATDRVPLTLALLLHGAGLGLFQVASLDIVAASLPRSNRGVAGSLALVMRTVGVVMAASILTLVFAHFHQGTSGLSESAAFVFAFQTAFQSAAFGLTVFVIAWLFRPNLWSSRRS